MMFHVNIKGGKRTIRDVPLEPCESSDAYIDLAAPSSLLCPKLEREDDEN